MEPSSLSFVCNTCLNTNLIDSSRVYSTLGLKATFAFQDNLACITRGCCQSACQQDTGLHAGVCSRGNGDCLEVNCPQPRLPCKLFDDHPEQLISQLFFSLNWFDELACGM